jgi:RNA polymerase sigma-70 factor (ECF subfamily)
VGTAASFDSVLEACRANAEGAWAELYETHAPRVLQFLRAQRVQDPEAVLGDVFVNVVRGLHTFQGDDSAFVAWIFRIARNAAIDQFRQNRDLLVEELPERPDDGLADMELEHREDEEEVYRLLEKLPPDQRSVVYLRVALDLPFDDVAGIMDRKVGAVKMLQQRAFATLRKETRPLAGAGMGGERSSLLFRHDDRLSEGGPDGRL